MLQALDRYEHACGLLASEGLSHGTGWLFAYAWSEEGMFKTSRSGILAMSNVLNALMLSIALPMIVDDPPEYFDDPWQPDSEGTQVWKDNAVQAWIACTYASVSVFMFNTYITSFLYTSVEYCGCDLEVLMLMTQGFPRKYYTSSVYVGSFLGYLFLTISLLLHGYIVFGDQFAYWISVGFLLILTLVVVAWGPSSSALVYGKNPILKRCYDGEWDGGDIQLDGDSAHTLKPEWEDKLSKWRELKNRHPEGFGF